MKPGYEIVESIDQPYDLIYILNWHGLNEVGVYSYCSKYNIDVPEQSENTVAKFTIKPKPCQTQSLPA